MKQYRNRVITLAALALLFVMLLGAVSCGTQDFMGTPSITTTENEERYVTDVTVLDGQIMVRFSDGTIENLGAANTYVTNNSVTVNGMTDTVRAQSASTALLSTVGIECGFSVTQVISTGFFGGYTTREVIQYASGSGVIYQLDKVSGDAYIITNYHVVYHESSNDPRGISQRIGVYMLGDSVKMDATFIGGSDKYDIAVLRIENEGRLKTGAAQAAALSDAGVTVGDRALIVGNANGLGLSVTEGIISVDSEDITMTAIRDTTRKDTFRVIRTDSSVNPGNSGGGIYNANAQLIGIVNAKTVDEDTEGMGYAIPVDVAVTIADKVIDGDVDSSLTTRRVDFGVVTDSSASRLVYDPTTGLAHVEETVTIAYDAAATSTSVAVDGVVAGGLGDLAGLRSGDRLVSVQVGTRARRSITREFHFADELLKARAGETVTIVVMRAGAETTLTVTVPTNYYG